MTPAERVQAIRQDILDQGYGYIGQPRTASQFYKFIRNSGTLPDVTQQEVETQLKMLCTLGYLKTDSEETPTPGILGHVITEEGVRFMEKQGLV